MDSSVNFDKQCRLCGTDVTEPSEQIEIFKNVMLLEKIRKYLQIAVIENDFLPKVICITCSSKLDSMHRFVCLASRTEKNYLNLLKTFHKRNNLSNTNKKKATIKRESDLENGVEHQLYLDGFSFENGYALTTNDPAKLSSTTTTTTTTTDSDTFPNRLNTSQIGVDTFSNNSAAMFKLQNDSKVSATNNSIVYPNNELTIFAYDDLKLGQLIRDQELLKVILKALKWDEKNRQCSNDVLLERLKITSFRDILSNSNLLKDGDLLQLIKSYVGQETFSNIHNGVKICNPFVYSPYPETTFNAYKTTTSAASPTPPPPDNTINNRCPLPYDDNESVTQMEVGVDPALFLPYDDDDDDGGTTTATVDGQLPPPPSLVQQQTQSPQHQQEQQEQQGQQQQQEQQQQQPTKETDRKTEALSVAATSTAEAINSIIKSPSKIEPILVNRRGTSDKVRLKCTTCPKSFPTNVQLQEHVLTHLLKKKRIDGKKKSVTFAPRQKSERRGGRSKFKRSTPGTGKFDCGVCGKGLSTKGNLKVHLETHKHKGKYTCDKFKTSKNLYRRKDFNAGEKFSCNTCGRVYATNSTLKAHSISHSDLRPHICPMCDKTFKRNQDLKFHINQHTGARPYKCPFCTKTFASSGNCFSHRKRMHFGQTENDGGSSGGDSHNDDGK